MQRSWINGLGFLLLPLFVWVSCKVRKSPESSEIEHREPVVTKVDSVMMRDTSKSEETEGMQQEEEISLQLYYQDAFKELKKMLESGNYNFKQAVFITENAYYAGKINQEGYSTIIQNLAQMARLWAASNRLQNYSAEDSADVLLNYAIYKVLKDTIFYVPDVPLSASYTYDFEDFSGAKDWSKMFVTKLLASRSGNCHSLPYLYKILADELGATAWLSIAPNHIYIKNRCKKIGWFNTELTSGAFPTDAWVKASGYISLEAIRSGIYMDTLSRAQNLVLCVYDLAKGYEKQTGIYGDGFILSCCNLVLRYYPNHINSILLKAEVLKKQFEEVMKTNAVEYPTQVFHIPEALALFEEMEKWYIRAVELGYYEMPEEMYLEWLISIQKEQETYLNSQTNTIFNR